MFVKYQALGSSNASVIELDITLSVAKRFWWSIQLPKPKSD